MYLIFSKRSILNEITSSTLRAKRGVHVNILLDVFFCPYDGLLTGHLTNHCFLGFFYEICYPFYQYINL